MKKLLLLPIVCLLLASCVSTKNTIMNIDESAPEPRLKGDAFVLTETSTNPKYGFDPDYPVNVYYRTTRNETINAERYLRALAGPNGEKIFFKKIDSCCPFPSTHTEMGAGFVDLYEVRWVGQKKKMVLYVNIYSKGEVKCPMGLTIKS